MGGNHRFVLHGAAVFAVLAGVTGLAAGCSGGGTASPPHTSTATASSTTGGASATATSSSAVPKATEPGVAPATLAGRCGTDKTLPSTPPAPFTFTTADGVTLLGVEFGTGPQGVVGLHELGGDGLCGWVSYAMRLATEGLHVLIFDHRCIGLSTCPGGTASGDVMADAAAARTELLRRGATTTALLGASQGGGEALAAASTQPGWTKAAVLSGAVYDNELGGGVTVRNAVPKLGVPVLFLCGDTDPDSPLALNQALIATAPAGTITLQVIPDGSHGWSLLQSYAGAPFTPQADQVQQFLAA